MKLSFLQLAVIGFLAFTLNSSAAVLYVDLNSASPTSPYTNWATAAKAIQDAVDAANPGDQILVTNGVYQTGGRVVYGAMTNRVAVTKSITVQSINGPKFTLVRGYQVPGTNNGDGAVRCVYLTNGASLYGFTLTNGATRATMILATREQESTGGGVWCESSGAVVSNCVLTANSAFLSGGGASFGTLNNCTISNNTAGSSGGGTYCSVLNNCVLNNNSSTQGGGAAGGTLNYCLLASNSITPIFGAGGGAFLCTLNNCKLIGNSTRYNGGGAEQGTLNNCLLIGNTAGNYGGGADNATLNNCTVISNSATYGGGAYQSNLRSCIIYYNPGGENLSASGYSYSCTTPIGFFWGSKGNFTNAPLFVDLTGGDLHLQSNSPCINSGNNTYATNTTDLDGNPRVLGGTVDIGAYEFQSPVAAISYAWLQQYGLPTDGSADYADLDGDGMNNWQEWIAGTNPTNALSALKMVSALVTNRLPGLAVTWQSVTNWTYYLQRSTNLASQPAFVTIQSNIFAMTGITTYNDTTATNSSLYFYRVGVQ